MDRFRELLILEYEHAAEMAETYSQWCCEFDEGIPFSGAGLEMLCKGERTDPFWKRTAEEWREAVQIMKGVHNGQIARRADNVPVG